MNQKNIGTQIKSPVVWLVGMRRQLPMEIQNPMVQLVMERLLGQVLFVSSECCWLARRKTLDRQFEPYAAYADPRNHFPV